MTQEALAQDELIRSLVDRFSLLADEVQHLSDRKTILEHKLRFAHEQVCEEIRYLFAFVSFRCFCYLYDDYLALDLESC